MNEEMQEIINKLNRIEVEISHIREIMPNKDMFLDAKERKLIIESYNNEKKGLLVPAKEARKKLGL